MAAREPLGPGFAVDEHWRSLGLVFLDSPAALAALYESSGGEGSQAADGGVQADAGRCGDGGRACSGPGGDRVEHTGRLRIERVAGQDRTHPPPGKVLTGQAHVFKDVLGIGDANGTPVPHDLVTAR